MKNICLCGNSNGVDSLLPLSNSINKCMVSYSHVLNGARGTKVQTPNKLMYRSNEHIVFNTSFSSIC